MISTGVSKLKVTDVNPVLICVLCKGYYIDATTINECLHSFCKTCIVRYLRTHKYCPICDVLVCNPLQNIRSDKRLQNVVYKLVPGLYEREMQRRRSFYSSLPSQNLVALTAEEQGIITEDSEIILPDENISIALEYLIHGSDVNKGVYSRRYLRCKASARVAILHKFLRNKFNLSCKHTVEIVCNNQVVSEDLTIMDVAYIYQWKQTTPIYLGYRILETKVKRVSRTGDNDNSKRVKTSEESLPSLDINTVNTTVDSNHFPTIVSDQSKLKPEVFYVNSSETHFQSNSDVLHNNQGSNSEWVELKINDDGEMKATVVKPMTHVNTNTNMAIITAQESQYVMANVTPVSNYVTPSSVHDTKPISLQPNEVTKVNLSFDQNSSQPVKSHVHNNFTSNLLRSPQETTLQTSQSSKDSIPPTVQENKLLVHPMIQGNKKTNQMNFKAPAGFLQKTPRPRASSNAPKYRTLKTGLRQWNLSGPRNKIIPGGSTDPLKTQDNISKIYKSRNATPRFIGNPTNVTSSPYQLMPLQNIFKSRVNDPSILTKVDPKTLGALTVTSSSNIKPAESPTYISNSSVSHVPVDKQAVVRPPQIKDYSPFLHPNFFYPGFLPYPTDINPLIPNTHPDFMKAMSALYQNTGFHSSLPPSVSTLFNPHITPVRSGQTDKKVSSPSISIPSSRSTAQPMSPSRSTAQPMSPSRSIAQPISPSRSTSKPMSPSMSTSQPMSPTRSTAQLMSPSRSMAQPMSPSRSMAQPMSPSRSLAQPMSPSRSTAQPMSPSRSTAQPMSPSRSTAQPMSPSRSTAQPMSPSRSIAQPMSPSRSIAQPMSPSTSITQPISPFRSSGQPMSSKSLYQPMTPSRSTAQLMSFRSAAQLTTPSRLVGLPISTARLSLTQNMSSSESPRSSSNSIYSLSSLPSSVSVSTTIPNVSNLVSKSYVPLVSISNSKTTNVNKNFSLQRNSSSSVSAPSSTPSLVSKPSISTITNLFSPANMVSKSHSPSLNLTNPSSATKSFVSLPILTSERMLSHAQPIPPYTPQTTLISSVNSPIVSSISLCSNSSNNTSTPSPSPNDNSESKKSLNKTQTIPISLANPIVPINKSSECTPVVNNHTDKNHAVQIKADNTDGRDKIKLSEIKPDSEKLKSDSLTNGENNNNFKKIEKTFGC